MSRIVVVASPLPKIDVDSASREKLIAHIDELEWMLESILPERADVERVREWLGISPHRASILITLSSGRVITTEHLCLTIGRFQDELAPSTVTVQICKLRKLVGHHGIQINSVWGVGYQLDAGSVPLIQSIMRGEG